MSQASLNIPLFFLIVIVVWLETQLMRGRKGERAKYELGILLI